MQHLVTIRKNKEIEKALEAVDCKDDKSRFNRDVLAKGICFRSSWRGRY